MTVYQDGIDITLPAAADLSSHQYKAIVVDANGRGTLAAGSGTVGVGLLQNKPAAQDRAAVVRIAGTSKFNGQDAVNEADLLTSNAQGFLDATTTDGAAIFGMALTATAGSAEIGQCLLMHFRY